MWRRVGFSWGHTGKFSTQPFVDVPFALGCGFYSRPFLFVLLQLREVSKGSGFTQPFWQAFLERSWRFSSAYNPRPDMDSNSGGPVHVPTKPTAHKQTPPPKIREDPKSKSRKLLETPKSLEKHINHPERGTGAPLTLPLTLGQTQFPQNEFHQMTPARSPLPRWPQPQNPPPQKKKVLPPPLSRAPTARIRIFRLASAFSAFPPRPPSAAHFRLRAPQPPRPSSREELEPQWAMMMFERLGAPGEESSNGFNNAGAARRDAARREAGGESSARGERRGGRGGPELVK